MLRRPVKFALRSAALGLAVCIATVLSGDCARAQSSAATIANVDDTAGLSTRRPANLNHAGAMAAPDGFDKLKLTPGSLLQMSIYTVPEMSTELRVDPQGNVSVPLLGAVHIAGDTLPEAQAAIAKELVEHDILKAPQVTLNVIEFSGTSISVLGEVESPGRIQMLEAKPLGDVLALAQGESQAAGDDIEIQHHTEGQHFSASHVRYAQGGDTSLLQSTLVYPGDTVIVHKAGVVYVLGAVTRPGGYMMINGGALNVSQAVSLAGGTNVQAQTKWAMVVRSQGTGYSQFKIPLKRMETGSEPPTPLQVNDVLYIPTSSFKAVMINGSNILGAVSSASIYRVP